MENQTEKVVDVEAMVRERAGEISRKVNIMVDKQIYELGDLMQLEEANVNMRDLIMKQVIKNLVVASF